MKRYGKAQSEQTQTVHHCTRHVLLNRRYLRRRNPFTKQPPAVFRKLEHVMPFSWNKINTCNNTSHIFPCVDSSTIAWTIRACQQCGSCKRLQVFSIVFLTGICCASGRSPVTGIQGSRKAQITNIRAAFSIYFLQQQSVSTLVCLKKRATACNCPLFCSCFPPSDFGLVRVCFLANMSPYVTLHSC